MADYCPSSSWQQVARCVVIKYLNSLTSEVSASGATAKARRGRGFQAPRKTSKLGAQARDNPSYMEELTAEARAP
jgi:hypothetical protein